MNFSHTSRSPGFTPTTHLDLQKAECGLKNLKHISSIEIPKATLTAPFLQYSALTPAQKQYLRSVCDAYSEARMRALMQQHYLNVLRRSIKTGNLMTNRPMRRCSPEGDEISDGAQKGKTSEQKTGFLPKINSLQKTKRSAGKEKTTDSYKH